jgi:all-trans-retinol 13,14-reductase
MPDLGGAVYGFAPQTRGFMPSPKTKIKELYLASAFTAGGGFTGAILGGGWAERAAIKAEVKSNKRRHTAGKVQK